MQEKPLTVVPSYAQVEAAKKTPKEFEETLRVALEANGFDVPTSTGQCVPCTVSDCSKICPDLPTKWGGKTFIVDAKRYTTTSAAISAEYVKRMRKYLEEYQTDVGIFVAPYGTGRGAVATQADMFLVDWQPNNYRWIQEIIAIISSH